MKENKTEQNNILKDAVTERISELLSKSEKLKSYEVISKGVTTLTAIGAVTTGLGHMMTAQAVQNDLLSSTIALGGISVASAVTNRILTKKLKNTEKETKQLEKLSVNRYIKNMQNKEDLNYDNFSAAQLANVEDVEIEF